ncbi:MAG TPA: hypothetical protein VF023_12115 [Bryobacteraceae bacterium]
MPTVRSCNHIGHERLYYTFMMSHTGLTFGTVAPLFDLPDHVIFQIATEKGRQSFPPPSATTHFAQSIF